MTSERKALFWITGFVVFGMLLHALSSILLPFVAGMAIAYFLDPLADWLEKHKLSRTKFPRLFSKSRTQSHASFACLADVKLRCLSPETYTFRS